MQRKDSLTKDHIVAVAAGMIAESGSDSFRILDVAKKSNVGVPTVYYHFESRNRLVSEAQLLNYEAISQPIYGVLEQVEAALAAKDEPLFTELLEQHSRLIWNAGRPENDFGVISILTDIWADATTRNVFRGRLLEEFTRWIAALELAQSFGWADGTNDAKTTIVMLWASCLGQAITVDLDPIDVSADGFRDFYMKSIKG